MALKLESRQRLANRLTPAMHLGLDLLALPINDLRKAVKKEIDLNPALLGAMPLAPDFAVANERARGKTLAEHLLGELRMMNLSEEKFRIATAVVGELDENGYFRGEIPSMQMTLEVDADAIEKARQLVMTIDPKGCGAKDLKECLFAQIGIVPKAKRAEFEKGIANLLNESVPLSERISDFAKPYVQQMKVNPGKLFAYEKINYITPDASVDANGEVTVDQKDIPVVSVSPKYLEMAKDTSLDAETREYAKAKVKRAREFVAAVERRRSTLAKICQEVIKKPSTMTEVAKRVNCSVATVSRAANRKYVKTPRGILPLRRFFVVGNEDAKACLKRLLAAQPVGAHITDAQLAEQMSAAGFKIARRTVAKYRTQLKKE